MQSEIFLSAIERLEYLLDVDQWIFLHPLYLSAEDML